MESQYNDAIQLFVGKMDSFNFAQYQNNVSPIRNISIRNNTGDTIEGLILQVESELDFFPTFKAELPPIPSGKPVSFPSIPLEVNGNALAERTETTTITIAVEILFKDQIVAEQKEQMTIFAYNEWSGARSNPDMLAAFVMPNHPVISNLMLEAAQILKKWKKPVSLEGYQSGDPNRVRDLAAAAYAAIQKKNIVYAEPPASFEEGQKIRTPELIIEQHMGTCMDMTLLYAACLEAMGLHPLLVLMRGHIYAGIWLDEKSFDNTLTSNPQELLGRFDTGTDELTFVECTAMCAGRDISFDDAEATAKYGNLSNLEEFAFAIDVFRARRSDIKPIPVRTSDNGKYQIDVKERKLSEVTNAPLKADIVFVDTEAAKGPRIMTKKDLWESKLLDLSQRNMLLNLPHNRSIEPIMSSHVDELEDALADGEEFHLMPTAEWVLAFGREEEDSKGKKKTKLWIEDALEEYGVFEMTHWPTIEGFDFNERFRQEFRNHRLYTYNNPSELDKVLTKLYRTAKSAQQENGVSSLYLAIGLLRWFDEGIEYPSYAPLILVPIEIIRKSAKQGYALHMRDEDPHFNTTLLEMLRQKYGIEVGGLEPLPTDEHGVDIKKVFAILRSAIYSLQNWDVVESCVIGNFSFAQFAMWNDIHQSEEWLEGSKVVRSIMKGHVDWDVNETQESDNDQIFLPITVDATQLEAIKMAASGKTFVLHGPPGTGKSQTITAMIANLMAQGKSVLFVAEKMAALSVVQRRLTSLGIGDFCLEIHSDKASKKQVLEQLAKAMDAHEKASAAEEAEYKETLEKAGVARSRLDSYEGHLHEIRQSGFSLRELIDLYENLRDNESMIRFDSVDVDSLTNGQIRSHAPRIKHMIAAGSIIRNISASPLRPVHITEFTANLRQNGAIAAKAYKESLRNLCAVAPETAKILSFTENVSFQSLQKLDEMAGFCLGQGGSIDESRLLMEADVKAILAYYNNEDVIAQEEERMLSNWKPEFLSLKMGTFREKYDTASRKLFGKGNAIESVRQEIQYYSSEPVIAEQIPSVLNTVEAYQKNMEQLVSRRDDVDSGTKIIVSKFNTREAFEEAYQKAKNLVAQMDSILGGLDVEQILNQESASDTLQKYHDSYREMRQKREAFDVLMNRELTEDQYVLTDEIALCDYIASNPATLKDWSLYQKARQACVDVGLTPVVDAYEDGMDINTIIPAYQKGLYFELINHIILDDEVLGAFSGATFNESIRQFKRLDDILLNKTKSEIRSILADKVPTSLSSPQQAIEVNLLRKAIGSNGRGMSIRELFERIPHIMKKLTPCVLMSPNSVAQYLARDNELFDVVIFDEASQLPTCKAVGALARAKDAVIVGDPKQMPPTSFFAGSGPEVSDLALEDLDSILDDALALGIPSQHLQWHYRSTHESLIAFSNSHFYENRMFTFPSANDRERHVTAVHVDGVYKKGTNVKEAEAIVAEIVRRYHDPVLSKRSVGVVTFNVKQQELILDLLGKQLQDDVGLDKWVSEGEDSLFIKNLENVQGDERDAILFSVGYGPDEKGRISMNFGPINREGGGKRLNVAFSRSRVEMMIFASMYSSDIVVTESSPDGVRAFRDFLKYAEGQSRPADAYVGGNEEESLEGIIRSICQAIKEHGYTCETMIGHSDFRIDIAVINPYDTDEYLMGIMLDGDTYHNTGNTRDREVAQISVLRGLGWDLVRVWAIDWWDNREKVLARLLETIDELDAKAKAAFDEKQAIETERLTVKELRKEKDAEIKENLEKMAKELEKEAEEEEKKTVEPIVSTESPAVDSVSEKTEELETAEETEAETEAIQESTPEPESAEEATDDEEQTPEEQEGIIVIDYEFCDLPSTPIDSAEYASRQNRDEIIRRAELLVQKEGPILRDALVRRLMSSFGISKSKAAMDATDKALRIANVKNAKLKGVVFCWPQEDDPEQYNKVRVTNERPGEELSPQEIRNAVCYVLQTNGPMAKDDLIKETSRLFGYKRLGGKLEGILVEGLKYTRANKYVFVNEDREYEYYDNQH